MTKTLNGHASNGKARFTIPPSPNGKNGHDAPSPKNGENGGKAKTPSLNGANVPGAPPSPNGENGCNSKAPSPNGANGQGAAPSPASRNANGRFAAGNAGGPGNPFARQLGALRSALINAVSQEDIQAIVRKLAARAKKGNLAAVKILFSYVIGRPADSIDPDRHDIEEYQALKELPQAASLLECLVGDKVSFAEAVRMMRFLLPVIDQQTQKRLGKALRDR